MHRPGKEPETPGVSDFHYRPNLVDYSSNMNVTELESALKDMRDKVRWSKEIKSDPSKRI